MAAARLITLILAEQMVAFSNAQSARAAFATRLAACADLAAQFAAQSGAGSAAAELDEALDDLVFRHAQDFDIARQTAALLAAAMNGLSRDTLSLAELRALYVTDEQRRLHDALLATQA